MAQYNQVPPNLQSGINVANTASHNDSSMHMEMHSSMQPMAGPSQQAGAFEVPIGLLEDRFHRAHARQMAAAGPFGCCSCPAVFGNDTQLRKHGSRDHKPYACICGTKCTRLDALNRHVTAQSSDMPQFPCDYCYDRQGEKAFRRYDDLVQHLKGHHKIETADKLLRGSTDAVADGQGTGGVQQPLFGCFFPGCTKWGLNGYLRQVDLDEHQIMMQHTIDLLSFDI